MNVLVSGGSKSGKSMFAQRLAREMAAGGKRYYIATMIPGDEEDLARIRRHQAERAGWGFETLEQGRDIPALLARPEVDAGGVFLLDSVTAVLGNEMFSAAGEVDPEAPARLAADLVTFAEATGNTIFVSDFIYGDAPEGSDYYGELTEDYRRGLAQIDRSLAAVCDRVYRVSAGLVQEWK